MTWSTDNSWLLMVQLMIFWFYAVIIQIKQSSNFELYELFFGYQYDSFSNILCPNQSDNMISADFNITSQTLPNVLICDISLKSWLKYFKADLTIANQIIWLIPNLHKWIKLFQHMAFVIISLLTLSYHIISYSA